MGPNVHPRGARTTSSALRLDGWRVARRWKNHCDLRSDRRHANRSYCHHKSAGRCGESYGAYQSSTSRGRIRGIPANYLCPIQKRCAELGELSVSSLLGRGARQVRHCGRQLSGFLAERLDAVRDGRFKTGTKPQIRGLYLRSFRTIAPPFITNFTRSSSVMSLKGLPATAMMSAYLPFSIVPIRSCQPIRSAPTAVEARRA